MFEDRWLGREEYYNRGAKSCYHSVQRAVRNVIDRMLCRARLKRWEVLYRKGINSVEEEQHSSNTLVVVQENNTEIRHKYKSVRNINGLSSYVCPTGPSDDQSLDTSVPLPMCMNTALPHKEVKEATRACSCDHAHAEPSMFQQT